MSRFAERLDSYRRNYDMRSERFNFNKNKLTPIQIILALIVMCYPIGAWFSLWNFSGIAMVGIILILLHVENFKQNEMMIEDIRLFIMETQRDIMDVKTDTDKQLSELLSPNKVLLSKVAALEEYIKEQFDTLGTVMLKSDDPYLTQLETVITKKINSSTEHLETVTAMKTEEIKTAIFSKARAIETTIHEKSNPDNIEAIESLDDIVEQFEGLAEKNEELYSTYEPLIEQVDEISEHIEYGNILNEQIRLLMKNNAKLINKNEALVEQVEQLLSYQRNK